MFSHIKGVSMNGWIVIGACIATLAVAVLVLFGITQL